MMHRLKIIIYYLLISKLPNSRYLKISNKIRTWYVSTILKILKTHKNNSFQERIYIGNGKNIEIGKHCQINENVFIQGATIGNYVMIAPNVSILNSTHKFDKINIPIIQQKALKNNKPIIEYDVWLSRNIIILPSIKIYKGSIIAASSIVTKKPARLIKKEYNLCQN